MGPNQAVALGPNEPVVPNVTPDDEHEGRGPAIREARRAGLARAREQRLADNRGTHPRLIG